MSHNERRARQQQLPALDGADLAGSRREALHTLLISRYQHGTDVAALRRVLAVDEDRSSLQLIVRVLEPLALAVSIAETGDQAIALLQNDIGYSAVILAWPLSGISGVQVLDRLLALRPGISAIVTSREHTLEVKRAFAGHRVSEFLPKPFTTEALVAAVMAALSEYSGMVGRDVNRMKDRFDGYADGSGPRLTSRETQVVQLICEGVRTREIAAVLGISFKTAACHREHIMQKLGIHSSAGIVRYAIRKGIVLP